MPCQMVVSVNRGPQHGPKHIMILVLGTTIIRPPILGNSQISFMEIYNEQIRDLPGACGEDPKVEGSEEGTAGSLKIP